MMAHVVRAPGVLAFVLFLGRIDLDGFIHLGFELVLADFTR